MADSKISHPDIHPKQFDRGFEMTDGGTQIPISSTTYNLPPPTPSQHICILRHDVYKLADYIFDKIIFWINLTTVIVVK